MKKGKPCVKMRCFENMVCELFRVMMVQKHSPCCSNKPCTEFTRYQFQTKNELLAYADVTLTQSENCIILEDTIDFIYGAG